MLIDTHCHIHEADYPLPLTEVLQRAASAGVDKMICVGTSEQSSADAVKLASQYDNLFASVGVHPHDTKDGYGQIADLAKQKVVAIGEVGLDYFYDHSPRDVQITALESQIQTAIDNNLSIIFHVRDASSAERLTSVWDDFWPIFDNFHGITGVLHSFTDSQANLEQALSRNLYIGVNGISTFTKDINQQHMFAHIPLQNLLLETDAPFLSPAPYRGKTNEPSFVGEVASHHAAIRNTTIDTIANTTSTNATKLFGL